MLIIALGFGRRLLSRDACHHSPGAAITLAGTHRRSRILSTTHYQFFLLFAPPLPPPLLTCRAVRWLAGWLAVQLEP